MSVSVPSALVDMLIYALADYTGMRLSYATDLAGRIAQIAVAAGESSLDYAQGYTNAMTSDVRSDLTNSLNAASDYLSDDIHILRQYVVEEMIPALDAIVEASGTIDEEIGKNIIKAYDAIADSHAAAGEVVENSIIAAGEWIGETYETASTFVNDGVMAAVAMVGDTVIEITKGIDRYTQSVLDVLIPAEMRAWFQTVGDILMGDPIRMLFDYGGRVFKTQLGELLTIDDKELQTWIGKARVYMEDIAMQAAKPGGAT